MRTAVSALLLTSLGGLAGVAGGDEGLPVASLGCVDRPGPGRISCEVRVSFAGGSEEVRWMDVVVLATPEHVRPLRSRVTAKPRAEKAEQRLSLALVASEPTEGVIRVKARAVLCLPRSARHPERCRTWSGEASRRILVGERSPELPETRAD